MYREVKSPEIQYHVVPLYGLMYSIDPQTLKEFGSEGTKAGPEYSIVKPSTPSRVSQHLVHLCHIEKSTGNSALAMGRLGALSHFRDLGKFCGTQSLVSKFY